MTQKIETKIIARGHQETVDNIARAYNDPDFMVYDMKSAYPFGLTKSARQFTMWDIITGVPYAWNAKVIRFIRSHNCKIPTMRHFWGNGTFWSWFFAWKTNPSGVQKCNCIFEYDQIE